jgi:hypothetical protein
MKYSATLNHNVGFLQWLLHVEGPEIALAAREHYGHDVHRALVDEPGAEGSAAEIAGGDGNVAVAGEFRINRDARGLCCRRTGRTLRDAKLPGAACAIRQ